METKAKRKFNIIDLLFIILIVAVLAVVAWKFIGRAGSAKTVEYIVTVHSDDVPNDALKGFKEGDVMLDETEKPFGTIISIKTGEARVHYSDSEGNDVVSPKEDYSELDVELRVSALKGDHFITLNGKKYSINTGFTAISGFSKIWVRISDIQPAE